MPNRIIKESICTSKNLNLLSAEEEVFFYRLMVNADDFGRFEADPEILRAKCFPRRIETITRDMISQWLLALAEAELICLYEVDGDQYGYFLTWEKHQQKRARHSKYPAPPSETSEHLQSHANNVISDDINCNHVIAYVPENRESRNENTRNENTRNENTRNEIELECEQVTASEISNACDEKETALASQDASPSLKKQKLKYAEFVTLTEEEYAKLVKQFGEDGARDWIEKLNLWKGSKGKKTKSDYYTILNWARMEREGMQFLRGSPSVSKNKQGVDADELVKYKENRYTG